MTAVFGLFGCQSKYMKFDDQGRLIPVSEIRCEVLGTEMERSLCDTFEDLYDLERVQICAKRELLSQFAKRDGPGSATYRLLEELDGLHVVYDSVRISQIFREGLAELDQSWERQERAGLNEEIARRAEQVLEYHCFLPESVPHFDDLGLLIVQHGPCQLETWTPTTMTVSFKNGTVYWIGENEDYSHRILLVTSSLGELSQLQGKALEQLNDENNAATIEDIRPDRMLDLDDLARTRKLESERWRQIAVDVDYEPLEFSTINLHVIPTCRGNGVWNGPTVAVQEGPWDWSRALLDFYINSDELGDSNAPADKTNLMEVTYDISRSTDTGLVLVAQETLPFSLGDLSGAEDAGLAFRAVTKPFFTGGETGQGYYELRLKVSHSTQTAIRKFPFYIYEKQFELLVLDSQIEEWSGVPSCMRIPRARPGQLLTILIPYRKLPYSVETGAYSGRVNLYLINNEDIERGTVSVGTATPLKETEDQTDTARLPTTEPSILSDPASLVDSFELTENSPRGYLVHTFEIPRKSPVGKKLRRGKYTLGAAITAGGSVISEAITNNLRID